MNQGSTRNAKRYQQPEKSTFETAKNFPSFLQEKEI